MHLPAEAKSRTKQDELTKLTKEKEKLMKLG